MELSELLKQLKKRIDVSKDAEKTKERVLQLWKGFNNKAKREVLELADVSFATAHKAYQQGALTAALAIALAKVGNVSPLFVTAHNDTQGRFNQRSLNSFFEITGYAHLVEKPAPEPEPEPVQPDVAEPVYAEPDAEPTAAPDEYDINEDELILLISALNIRARWSDEARETLTRIAELLI
jgi:hypothetical protein